MTQLSEDKIKTIIDTAADAMIITDHSGKISTVNVSALKMFEYQNEEILGKNIFILFYDDSFNNKKYNNIEELNNHNSGEKFGKKSDGTLFPIEIQLSFSSEEPCFFVISIKDLSKNKRVYDSLKYKAQFEIALARISASLVQSTFDGIDNAIKKELGSTGEFLSANRCYILSLQDGKLQCIYYWFDSNTERSPTDWNKLSQEDAKWIISRIEKRQCIYIPSVQKFDEEYRKVMLDLGITTFIAVPMSLDKKFVAILVIDKTVDSIQLDPDFSFMRLVSQLLSGAIERKNIELNLNIQKDIVTSTLQQKDEYLDDFTRVISHDLKFTCQKLLIQTDLLEILTSPDNKANIESINKKISGIKKSSSHIFKLVEGLYEYSSMETNNIDMAVMSMNDIINDAKYEMFGHLNYVSCDILPSIHCSYDLVRKMFIHLFDNSLKFSESRRFLHIEISVDLVDQDSNVIILRYEDNGIGFDNDYSDKIFDLCVKLDNLDDNAGVGIGLSLCKKIMDIHGGCIEAHGSPAVGARFYITFPYAPPYTVESS